MTRHLTLLGFASLATLAACKGDISVTQIDAELSVSPSLTDRGTVPVGSMDCFTVKIAHEKGGDIKISNVAVTNIEGTFFRLDGDPPKELLREETLEVPLCYEPADIGYHRGTVEVVHNGKDSPATVDIRAHAILPEATIWPLGVDFGPALVGETKTKQVVVANQSDDLDLEISEASFSNDVFSLVTPLPILVGSGDEKVVQLAFNPTDLTAQLGTMTLRAGDVGLPQVDLRGNDCESGDPEAYDEDGDGYTSCAGDCDDDDFDIHPGAIELANGVDDNCDGDADEGTVLFDDDGDGFCEGPGACTDGSMPGDCSDSADPSANTVAVNPNATEIADNGIDDDCDGVVDQGTTDADSDGYSPAGGDCDDNDALVFPGAPEIADFLDNDCDGTEDEGTVYYDDDGDGYCEDAVTCSDGSTPGDCDDDIVDRDGVGGPDGRPTNPGAVELADWRDNNCNTVVDEGTVNFDDDGDGYTEIGGDCNDSTADMNGDGVPDGATQSPALGNCP